MPQPELCASLQDCQKLKTVRWTGTWQLSPQRAMSLLPRKNSQLLIVQGCAWITWGHPSSHRPGSGGDVFLHAGQVIDVPAGAHLVMESRFAAQVLHFDWREMPAGLLAHPPLRAALPDLARQWGRAAALLGGATVRLLAGLWRSSPVASCVAQSDAACVQSCAGQRPT